MSRSARNKTIDTSLQEGAAYLNKCLQVSEPEELKHANLMDLTICGDSDMVMRHLPEKSIDLAIVDPPYNLSKNYNGSRFGKMNQESYEEYTRQWMQLIRPLIKDTGTIYVCCDWESSLIIGKVLGEFFTVRNRITWQREKGRGARSNWKNSMEDIWFATAGSEYTFNIDKVKLRRKVLAPYKTDGQPKDWKETEKGNFRDTCPSNFWDDITVPFWSMAENTAHPAQKPEKLISRLILASSNAGDMVFDPFLGSGTTSVTASKLGRHYLGIEKEARYCIWAEQRLEMAREDKTIQGFEDGVYWERNAKK